MSRDSGLSDDVPPLLRDPTTVLLHLTLILPIQIDRAYFTTIVRQVYNLCWIQTCLQLACKLTDAQRNLLKSEWLKQSSLPGVYMKIDNLASGLGAVIANLDSSGLFNSDLDSVTPTYPRFDLTSCHFCQIAF